MLSCFHPTAAGSPTNVQAMPNGVTGFKVSWTAPTSGATVTGYQVYYNGGTDWGSRDAMASDTTVTIPGLTLGLTYIITVVALSIHLPSPVIGAVMVNFGKYNASNNNEISKHIFTTFYN